MRIGVDIFGGDYAPEAIVKGCILAKGELPPDVQLVLIGNKDDVISVCKKENFDHTLFDTVHTNEFISMGEHPAKSFASKPNSSIVKGFTLLKSGEIDGFASAGNTGAMMVGVVQVVKLVPGIIRPGLAASFPNINGSPNIIIDVGINPDSKPDVLYQYGILGSEYSKKVFNVENPGVGLLNIGSEEEKGNLLTKAAYIAMKDSKDFNFIGNVEGYDILNYDKVDVIVCDGFVGNVVLKQTEGMFNLLKKRNVSDELFDKFNFENYGGTPVLGANAPVIIGHGVSQELAIKNMILHTKQVIEAKLTESFKEIFK